MKENNIMQHLKYAINNDEVTILSCERSACGDIELPDMINGYPVTEIGAFAFSCCKKITSIIIPKSIKKIGKYAFCFSSISKGLFYSGTYEEWNEMNVGENAIDFNVDVYAVSVNINK